jgi:hypothetical protein
MKVSQPVRPAGVAPLVLAAILVAALTSARADEPGRKEGREGEKPPPLKAEKITNTRNMRFGEILLVKPTGIEVYNTTGVNDCPPRLWNALDLDKIKKQYGAPRVEKNGPHYWMMDEQTVSFGEKVAFGGLEARWVATLNLAAAEKAVQGSEPYKVFRPKKTQKMVYFKGKPVYELVDPDGNVYVLQAHEEQFPIESLPKLGEKLKKLPRGWQYRTRNLTEDLVLDLVPDKPIYAVGDEFHQYYTRIPKGK